jgi:hypothetical protein
VDSVDPRAGGVIAKDELTLGSMRTCSLVTLEVVILHHAATLRRRPLVHVVPIVHCAGLAALLVGLFEASGTLGTRVC